MNITQLYYENELYNFIIDQGASIACVTSYIPVENKIIYYIKINEQNIIFQIKVEMLSEDHINEVKSDILRFIKETSK